MPVTVVNAEYCAAVRMTLPTRSSVWIPEIVAPDILPVATSVLPVPLPVTEEPEAKPLAAVNVSPPVPPVSVSTPPPAMRLSPAPLPAVSVSLPVALAVKT